MPRQRVTLYILRGLPGVFIEEAALDLFPMATDRLFFEWEYRTSEGHYIYSEEIPSDLMKDLKEAGGHMRRGRLVVGGCFLKKEATQPLVEMARERDWPVIELVLERPHGESWPGPEMEVNL